MNIRFSVAAALVVLLAATELKAKAGTDPASQKAPCDAKCRQDYQGNSAAIDACIRNCGAAGPASAGARSTTIKSSKSNSSDREAAPSTGAQPAEAVKSGKSNSSDRAVHPGATDPTPAEATTVKSSKSNSSERVLFQQGVDQDTKATPSGSTIKGSKSNSSDEAKFHGNTQNQTKTSNLNLSKSNVNREAGSSISGVVTNVDAAANTISLKRKDGSVIVMDASKLTGGLPKVGQSVKCVVNITGKTQVIAISDPDTIPPER